LKEKSGMTEQKYFQPSQNIVLRTLWQDRIWSAGPQTVIQDKPELLAFHIIPGTLWKSPCALNGGRVTPRSHARGEFVVNDEIWTDFYCLRLKVPGSDYSVELFFNLDLSFRAWYINMETPFRRTASGFDYNDEELDIILEPDLSSWSWKDTDELEESVDCGLISPERAAYLRQEGERVAKWIQSGNSPFNGWEKWRPDTFSKIPVLLPGWDKI